MKVRQFPPTGDMSRLWFSELIHRQSRLRFSSTILVRECSVPASCVSSTSRNFGFFRRTSLVTRQSATPVVSGDGRFVVFQSSASNLVAETSKSKTNIFLRDTCLGATASDGCTPATTLIGPETAGVSTNSDRICAVDQRFRSVHQLYFRNFDEREAPTLCGNISFRARHLLRRD